MCLFILLSFSFPPSFPQLSFHKPPLAVVGTYAITPPIRPFTFLSLSLSLIHNTYNMKFAKDLANESIPEWRKAYINYKGLKKKIKLIEKVSLILYICNKFLRFRKQQIVSKGKGTKSSY